MYDDDTTQPEPLHCIKSSNSADHDHDYDATQPEPLHYAESSESSNSPDHDLDATQPEQLNCAVASEKRAVTQRAERDATVGDANMAAIDDNAWEPAVVPSSPSSCDETALTPTQLALMSADGDGRDHHDDDARHYERLREGEQQAWRLAWQGCHIEGHMLLAKVLHENRSHGGENVDSTLYSVDVEHLHRALVGMKGHLGDVVGMDPGPAQILGGANCNTKSWSKRSGPTYARLRARVNA